MCTPVVTMLTESLVENYKKNKLGVSFAGKVIKWNTEEDVKDVVEAIQACESLKYLELEGNTLGVNAAKEIGKALESKPEFEVALWKDLFTGRLKNEIPQAMRFLFGGVDLAGARLQYLDLSDNAIGPLGMAGVAPFFQSESSFSLKVLICSNNGLGPAGGEEFAKALIACKELSIQRGGEIFNLKQFICGRNRMQNKGATAVSKFIQVCDSLEEIHMPENSIYWQAFQELAKGLANNRNLRVINLNDNTITGKGLDVLADAIGSLKGLRELNLGDCLIKSNGAMKIVNVLKDLSELEILVLEGNEINKEAGIKIANDFKNHPNLKTLNLSANGFGEDGIKRIQDILASSCITSLLLEECEDECDDEDEDEEGSNEGGEEECSDEEDEDVEYVEGEQSYEEYSGGEEEVIESIMRFLTDPTMENYRSIPESGLSEYIYDVPNDDRNPHDLFLHGAIGIIESCSQREEVISTEVEALFVKLMSEGLSHANSMQNEFIDSLISNLGLSQDKDKQYSRDSISSPLLENLAVWLIKSRDLPNDMLSSLKAASQDVRSSLEVDREKLSTLVDYVIAKRRQL